MEVILNDAPVYGVHITTKTGTILIYPDLIKDEKVVKTVVENDDNGDWYIVGIDENGDRISSTFIKEKVIMDYTIVHQKTDYIQRENQKLKKEDSKKEGHLSA